MEQLQKQDLEVSIRVLNALSEANNGVPVKEFVKLNDTGDKTSDDLVSKMTLEMLQSLKDLKLIDADDLSKSDAIIYGLTQEGETMHKLFLELSNAS